MAGGNHDPAAPLPLRLIQGIVGLADEIFHEEIVGSVGFN
jgi:hypothetical protein